MINLTITSLSISCCYSFSPLFTGNSNIISHSSIKNFFPTIFYNLDNLLLETSTFQRGVGSIVVSEKNKNILSNNINETVVNMEFSPSNMPIIQNTQGENTII